MRDLEAHNMPRVKQNRSTQLTFTLRTLYTRIADWLYVNAAGAKRLMPNSELGDYMNVNYAQFSAICRPSFEPTVRDFNGEAELESMFNLLVVMSGEDVNWECDDCVSRARRQILEEDLPEQDWDTLFLFGDDQIRVLIEPLVECEHKVEEVSIKQWLRELVTNIVAYEGFLIGGAGSQIHFADDMLSVTYTLR